MEKKTSKSGGVAAAATKTKRKVAPAPKLKVAPAPKRKAVVASKRAKPPAKVHKVPPLAPAIPTDEIALRAYFIAQNRRANGIPGDELSDWVEAERQLLSEQ